MNLKDAPPAVRKIVYAIVDKALARCDREGIAREDFYRAMLEVQEKESIPKGDVSALIERTFRRLAPRAN